MHVRSWVALLSATPIILPSLSLSLSHTHSLSLSLSHAPFLSHTKLATSSLISEDTPTTKPKPMCWNGATTFDRTAFSRMTQRWNVLSRITSSWMTLWRMTVRRMTQTRMLLIINKTIIATLMRMTEDSVEHHYSEFRMTLCRMKPSECHWAELCLSEWHYTVLKPPNDGHYNDTHENDA